MKNPPRCSWAGTSLGIAPSRDAEIKETNDKMAGEASPLGEDIGHLEMENQQAIDDFRRPSDA
jgi:hypothetical protein